MKRQNVVRYAAIGCLKETNTLTLYWWNVLVTLNNVQICVLSTVKFLVNTLRPRQSGRRFRDDIFKCNFLIEDVWISIKISLKFVPTGPINNIPALVQIMAWRRLGDKPLSESMMAILLTHICVTRPRWVNRFYPTCWNKFNILFW